MAQEPLASRIRPRTLDDFIGQKHLVAPGKPLYEAIRKKHLFSFILWGPPGVGKTTLAKLYAEAQGADFFELSAVSAGKEDIKRILESARREPPAARPGLFEAPRQPAAKKPVILFLDEIHRFNKAQQDFLLPHVERGDLTLVGATTENPSFEVIPALLSRCRVFVLESLASDEMQAIIERTRLDVDPPAREWLVRFANGDARQLLGILEAAASLYEAITVENLEAALQSKFLRYDKKGEEHYNTISAFIKSMRASQPDAALYYLARMLEAGEDPKFVARRMVIFASEDVGMKDPQALTVANGVFRAVEIIGLPEAGINLAHGVVYLAKAPKSKAAYYAYLAAMKDAREYGNLPIPMKLRNAPTSLMKELGYGEGYEKYTKEDLMPEELQGREYFKEGEGRA